MRTGGSHALAALVIAAGVLFVPACGDGGTPAGPAPARPTSSAVTGKPAAGAEAPGEPTGSGTGGVAAAIRPLPPAAAVPSVPAALPVPTALTVEALGVSAAPVATVGVDETGDMDVPGAREVGWYRYGPRPGDAGSAVLAAHVAYDGVDGVFRHLGSLAAGDRLTVAFAGGEARSFTVTEVTRVPKPDLPADTWARSGEPRLVLITCGGDFDAEAGSYEDNVVAYARPG